MTGRPARPGPMARSPICHGALRVARFEETDTHPAPVDLADYLCAHYDKLKRILASQLGCADWAAECLHETWIKLRGVPTRMSLYPTAYVRRVAHNVALDMMRSRGIERMGRAEESELFECKDEAPGPQDVAQARAAVSALIEAMNRLPRRQCAILLDVRLEKLTQRQAADRYAISLAVLRRELRRAETFCAQQLAQHGSR